MKNTNTNKANLSKANAASAAAAADCKRDDEAAHTQTYGDCQYAYRRIGRRKHIHIHTHSHMCWLAEEGEGGTCRRSHSNQTHAGDGTRLAHFNDVVAAIDFAYIVCMVSLDVYKCFLYAYTRTQHQSVHACVCV